MARAAETLGLQLRVGVHTGECEVRGDDLAGIAVHIGARLAHLAAPGELEPVILVVVSDHTSRRAILAELDRYTRDYRVAPATGGDQALARLAELQAAGDRTEPGP